MPKPKRTGGQRLKRFLREAKSAEAKSSGVDVGFMASSRYPSGLPVAAAAAAHEFGMAGLPERPFFRGAIESTKRQMRDALRRGIDPKTMVLDAETALRVGAALAGGVRQNLASDPPLIDTTKMIASVDVRVTPARGE